jgi:polysaccharide biosynthesis transport protein
MRNQKSASNDDLDFAALASSVLRRLPVILLCSAAVGAVTYGARMTMLPRYTAQAQLEVQSTGLSNPFDGKQSGGGGDVSSRMDKEAVGTHVGALKSTDLALKIAKDLKFAARPEFNAALPPDDLWTRAFAMAGMGGTRAGETDDDRALAAFYKALRVYQIKESRGITVEFTSADPRFSAEVANRLSEGYRASLAGRTIVETEDARVKLAPQIARLNTEIADADMQVNEFRGKANLFRGGPQNTALKDQQLGDLTAELSRIQTARSETNARASAAREMMARGTAEALPDVQKSALVPRMVEQRVRLERQISELSATLLPAHPRMKQMVADLAGLQKLIKSELQKVVDSIDKDAKIVVDRETDLKRRIDEIKATVVSSSADDGRLRTLEDAAKSKRDELARLQKLMLAAESTVSAKAVPVEIHIVSRAIPPSETAAPKNSMIAAFASFATLLLGIVWAFLRGLRRGPKGAQGSNEPSSRLTPAAPPQRDATEPTAVFAQASGGNVADAATVATVASLAADLLAKGEAQAGFRILLTGETKSTDASADAIALAKSLAAGGRHVILVDWLADGEGLARALSFSHKPGMTDLLQGTVSFDDVIQKIAGSDAHFIATGTSGVEPGSGEADRHNIVLDALDEAYEFIIVHGGHDVARELFLRIQGRFDAGVVVGDGRARTDGGTRFLGFDVPGMDIMTIAAMSAKSSVATQAASPTTAQPVTRRAAVPKPRVDLVAEAQRAP